LYNLLCNSISVSDRLHMWFYELIMELKVAHPLVFLLYLFCLYTQILLCWIFYSTGSFFTGL
jgi:hypothetical protein